MVSLSGRGDKDIDHVRHVLGDLADETGAWQRYADDNAAQKKAAEETDEKGQA